MRNLSITQSFVTEAIGLTITMRMPVALYSFGFFNYDSYVSLQAIGLIRGI